MAEIKLWPHQQATYDFGKDLSSLVDGSDPGCVDFETEFLTPIGWKSIKNYDEEDLVAQFHPSTFQIEFKKPLDYIVKGCSVMHHYNPDRGLDMMLSPEHRVLSYPRGQTKDKFSRWSVMSSSEFTERVRQRQIAAAFKAPDNIGVALTDIELKLMVAVMADGYFPNNTKYCIMRLKRERKKIRLKNLLRSANIEFKERQCGGLIPGFTVFSFQAPYRDKVYDAKYWTCTPAQLSLIAEECVLWDGDTDRTFRTIVKESADFIQYAMSSTMNVAVLSTQERPEADKPTEYVVLVRDSGPFVGPMRKESIKVVRPKDDKKYCFTTETSFWLARRNGRIFASGNTGKSIAHAKIIEHHLNNGGSRALITCPKTLVRSAWLEEFTKYLPNIKIALAEAPAANRKAAFESDADVVVLNVDGFKWLASQTKRWLTNRLGSNAILVNDESHVLKNPNALRTKAALKIAPYFTKKHVMSGTMAPNSIVELWTQLMIVDGGERLGKRYTQFRNLFQTPVVKGPFTTWEDKPGSADIVYGLIHDIVIRHNFSEVMKHVPDMKQSVVWYDLPKKHFDLYKRLEKETYLEHEGEIISALNASTLAGKLLQSASGAVYSTADDWSVLDTGRYDLIADLVDGRKHSLVFWSWKHQKEEIIRALKARNITYGVLDGSVKSATAREQVVKDMQAGRLQTLLMHPKTGAFGLTLTKATSTIYASPLYEAMSKIQGDARVRRGIQDKKTESIVILAKGTRDEIAYEVFSGKRDRLEALNDLFEG